MSVRGARRRAQARHGRGLQPFAVRKRVAPLVPQASFAQCELSVFLDSFVALAPDGLQPSFPCLGRTQRRFLHNASKHIEVVHVAQQILHTLQFVAPGSVVFWEEIFHRVAKTLQSDAQCVPRFRFFRAQRVAVEFFGFLVAFERKAFGRQAFSSKRSAAYSASSRSCCSLHSNVASSAARRGSFSVLICLIRAFSTCASRKAPSPRKSLRPTLRIWCQAGCGSTSSMAEAMERQRRMATRKSCTASASGE